MPDQWNIEWQDYYAILQISATAELGVLKAAHKALAKRYHPDSPAADLQRMQLINLSYETLVDPAARARYDKAFRERAEQTHSELQNATAQLQKIKLDLQRVIGDFNREKAARLVLQRKISGLEQELATATASQQEADRRANEMLLFDLIKNSPPLPTAPPPILPMVTAGSWKLPISIQTVSGMVQFPTLSFNVNHSVSGRHTFVQGGLMGAAAATFFGNWHYDVPTHTLTLHINVQVTLQILNIISNIETQHVRWLFKVTGGSPQLISVVDQHGTTFVLELVAAYSRQRWSLPARVTARVVVVALLLAAATLFLFGQFLIPALIAIFLISGSAYQ